MLLRFLQYLAGFVRFRATGGFSERFINLCSREGIPLWDVASRGGDLFASTRIKSYKTLRPVAKRAGMQLSIQKKVGLPFFLRRYRKRIGLLLGLLPLVLGMLVLSSRLWTINVTGNSAVSTEQILSVFADLGVDIGTRTKAIDVHAVQTQALERLPELLWLSVNLQGSAAQIEVREQGQEPALEDTKTPAHLRATMDGQIVVLEVYRGTALRKVGDAVLQGDLLVAGATANKAGELSPKRANGYVVAKVNPQLQASAPYLQQTHRVTGTQAHMTLHLLGLSIPLGKNRLPADQTAYSETTHLVIGGVTLPIGYTVQRVVHTEPVSQTYSEQEAKLLALEDYCDQYAHRLRGMHISGETIRGSAETDGYHIRGSYAATASIGAVTQYDTNNIDFTLPSQTPPQ